MTNPFYTCGIRDVTFVDEPNTLKYKRLEIYQNPSYDKQHVSDYLDENFEGMIFVYYILAQLFESRLALNPGLNLTRVSFSGVQKHFVG